MPATLIDTHCHFDPEDDARALIAEAATHHVRLIAVGGNATLNNTAQASGAPFALGYDWSCEVLPEAHPQAPGMVAVGELGIDFHYEQGEAVTRRQRDHFERQGLFARAAGLPIIVHTREADAETLAALRAIDSPTAGVIHSFTGDIPFARQLLDLGYAISLSGIVTFRNADQLREVARFLPADRILVETDSPYLAPVPHRGKRNRPAFVRATADFIAALRGIPCAEFAEQTTRNASALFRLPNML